MLPRKVTKLRLCVEDDFNDFKSHRERGRPGRVLNPQTVANKYVCLPTHINGAVEFKTRLVNTRESDDFGLDQSEDRTSKYNDSLAEVDLLEYGDDFLENWIQRSTFARE